MHARTVAAGLVLVHCGLGCYEESLPEPAGPPPPVDVPPPAPLPPPKVWSVSPTSGPWGTTVTITGTDLIGSGDGPRLVLGAKGEVVLGLSSPAVKSWTDTSIEV